MLKQEDMVAVILKPTEFFYAWITDVTLLSNKKNAIDADSINRGHSVLMIPKGNSSEVFTLFIMKHLNSILEYELSRWTTDKTQWPSRFDYDVLMKYFDLEIHTTVLNWNTIPGADHRHISHRYRNALLDIKPNALIVATPKDCVQEWLLSVFKKTKGAIGFNEFDFVALQRNASVYVLPQTSHPIETYTTFIKENHRDLFEFELNQLICDESEWPQNRTFDLFVEWFDFKIYSKFITAS